MALTVTIQNIRVVNGKGYIRFSSGREYEFRSVAEFQDFLSDIDEETAEKIALKIIRVRRPNLTNLAALIGRGISLDLTSDTFGTVV